MSNNRIYIAGRITGDPCYKAKFLAAENNISLAHRSCGGSFTCRGCLFYSPNSIYLCHIHDALHHPLQVEKPVRFGIEGRPYWLQMTVCLARLSRCRYAYFLRDWRESRGAQIEHRLATHLHKHIIYQQ